MITFNCPCTCYAGFLILTLLTGSPANAQSGVTFQLGEVREQLLRIDTGINNLGKTVDEIALVERSRCDRPVSWNRKFPGNERFVPALNGHAYCDLETGLVWEETPDPEATYWSNAMSNCTNREIDGRMGWHLATVEELQSLLEMQDSGLALPPGHPFLGVDEFPTALFFTSSPGQSAVYGFYPEIWHVGINGGPAIPLGILPPPFTNARNKYWCVRGGVTFLPRMDVNLEGDEIEPFPD